MMSMSFNDVDDVDEFSFALKMVILDCRKRNEWSAAYCCLLFSYFNRCLHNYRGKMLIIFL